MIRRGARAAAQLLFRFVAAAYKRRSIGLAPRWAFDPWGRFLPEHTTAVSMLDRLLHHANVVVTDGESHRMRQAKSRTGVAARKPGNDLQAGYFHLTTTGDRNLAIDSPRVYRAGPPRMCAGPCSVRKSAFEIRQQEQGCLTPPAARH